MKKRRRKTIREVLEWQCDQAGIKPNPIKTIPDAVLIESPFLNIAFCWDDTDQGVDFWSRIADEIEAWARSKSPIFWQDLLRRYCHHPECHLVKLCPERHFWCRDSLDLDTGIAWLAAETSSPSKLREFIAAVEMHKRKYAELYYLLYMYKDSFMIEVLNKGIE